MAALTAPRNTPQMGTEAKVREVYVPQKGNTKIQPGALVAIAAGYAEPGATALNLVAIGRYEGRSVSDSTSLADGAISVPVRRGCFKWDNAAGGDAIVAANLFGAAYIVDDHTVANNDGTGTRSKAGTIVQIDSDGVWVESP